MPTKKQTLQKKKDLKQIAREKPLVAAGVLIGAIFMLLWFSSILGISLNFGGVRMPNGAAVEEGDSLTWVGMRVIAINKSVRTEFKIPGNVKGMFVIDEGTGQAKNCGVKTGDVIVSISRKAVPNAHTFVAVANTTQYYGGILLDIFRDGESLYITIPFEYQYGPLLGPNQRSWQLGSPLAGKAFRYGTVFNGAVNPGNANNQQNR